MDQACFAAYAQIVQQAFGIQLPPEKKALLESRLFKLFQHEDERLPASCRTATGFLTWLRKDTTGRARKLLSEAITTHHTYFLREEDHFWYFRDIVLPWIAQAAAGRGGATAEHRLSPVQPLDARVPIPKALSCDLLPERHDLLRLGDAHRARTQILRLARARLVAARAGVQGSPGTPMPPGGALPRYTVGPRKGARGQTMRNGRTHSIRLIVMGASTGGTEALAAVLTQLVPPLPPIVIVQHIPPGFSELFARRIDRDCRLTAHTAREGEYLAPDHIYIAPGDRHVRVRRLGDHICLSVQEGPLVNGHCPSVDVLFQSVADQRLATGSLGVLLPGMGDDGAQGLLAMRQGGARTLGQDEATSVVYGMPRAAWEAGAVERQLPLPAVAAAIAALCARGPGAER